MLARTCARAKSSPNACWLGAVATFRSGSPASRHVGRDRDRLAVRAVAFGNGVSNTSSSPAPDARLTRVFRMINDRRSPGGRTLAGRLAREARLSRCQFLRIVQQFTSLTSHQYVRRAGLQRAAARLLLEPTRILDLALDSRFADISNCNHAFRSESGVSATLFRRACSPKRHNFDTM